MKLHTRNYNQFARTCASFSKTKETKQEITQYLFTAIHSNNHILHCEFTIYVIIIDLQGLVPNFPAVQNERDRISCRRPSYEEQGNNGSGLSVVSLLQAEMLSRQVGASLEVSCAEPACIEYLYNANNVQSVEERFQHLRAKK